MSNVVRVNFGELHECKLFFDTNKNGIPMSDDFFCPVCQRIIIIAQHG